MTRWCSSGNEGILTTDGEEVCGVDRERKETGDRGVVVQMTLAAYCCHSFCMCNAQLGLPHTAVIRLVSIYLNNNNKKKA